MDQQQLAEALAELERTPDAVAALARDLDRPLLALRPSDDAFSVLENVCHLRDIEAEGYLVRIRRILSETNPFLPDLDGARLAIERRYNDDDLGRALDAFRAARLASVAALRAAGLPALGRSAQLEKVGTITVRDLLNQMVEHDRSHLKDLAELRRSHVAR